MRTRGWGGDGTWWRWGAALGGSALLVWVAIGELAGEDRGWEERGAPGIAWTGDRLFVYGGFPADDESYGESLRAGDNPLDDAALIDTASGNVDRLPEPPFDRPLRSQPGVVAVGDDVVVVGDLCQTPRRADAPGDCAPGVYATAVYSIEDDEWRLVDSPPEVAQIRNGQHFGVGTTSDGRAVFVLGERGGVFGAAPGRQLWTYSVADDEWARVPSPDLIIEEVCLAGDTLVAASELVQAAATAGVAPVPGPGPTLRLFDLEGDDGGWLPAPPVEVTSAAPTADITCGEDTVLLDTGDGGSLRVYAIGPGGGWHSPQPMPGEDHHVARLWTGEEYLFLDPELDNLAYAPGTDEWRTLDGKADIGPEPVWTDDAAVGWPEPTDLPAVFTP
jgi:hypothetical protein